jgi:uncharacterized membrane protein
MHSNEAPRATGQADTLPPYLAETHRAISRLDSEHRERATRLERDAARLTRFIGRPSFLIGIGLAVLAWVAANGLSALRGWHPIDPPPFGLLQAVASVAALFVTILILTTQRREDELADRREQLTLRLAILGEQKTAKIIALLEELRRDSPTLHNREDHQARAMSEASGPQTVLDAIDAYRAEDDGTNPCWPPHNG